MKHVLSGFIALWTCTFATIPEVVLGDDIQAFYTKGYLDACTSRIQNVPLQVPMNELCISTAVKLCDLSLGTDQLGKCLPKVIDWLQKDVLRIQTSMPEAEKMAKRSFDLFAGLPIGTGNADCSAVDVKGASVEVFCNYQEAALEWHENRIIELSQ